MKLDARIARPEDIQIITRTGTVLANQTWSQTHVRGHSSGSTQYVGPNGGEITLPSTTITSSTSDRVQLFIREDDGREFDVSFTNPGVGVREGHRVSVLYVGNTAQSREQVVSNDVRIGALVNHDTGKHSVYERRLGQLANDPGDPISRVLGPTLVLAGVPVFIASIYFGFKWEVGFVNWVLFWLAYFALGGAIGLIQGSRNKKLTGRIVAAVRERVGSAAGATRP
jgi:hypothetical protein